MILPHSSIFCVIELRTSPDFPTSDADAAARSAHSLRASRCMARDVLAPPGLFDVSRRAAALAAAERDVLRAISLCATRTLAHEARRGAATAGIRGWLSCRRMGTGTR